MTIYEIDKSIEALVEGSIDPETGEVVIDTEKLDALQMERGKKVEGLALYVKNLAAEAAAIRDEEKNLAARRKATENAAERARRYLEYALAGEKLRTPRVSVSYRKSERLELDDDFYAPGLMRVIDPEPDKRKIAERIKAGDIIPGARLVETVSMQIK